MRNFISREIVAVSLAIAMGAGALANPAQAAQPDIQCAYATACNIPQSLVDKILSLFRIDMS
jgi:hypothetical protein